MLSQEKKGFWFRMLCSKQKKNSTSDQKARIAFSCMEEFPQNTCMTFLSLAYFLDRCFDFVVGGGGGGLAISHAALIFCVFLWQSRFGYFFRIVKHRNFVLKLQL